MVRRTPNGAGVHQEAVCHVEGSSHRRPLPDSERCTDGCLPSETKARRIKAGLSDELGIYLNFDPDSAGVGVQHGSCQQNGSESTRKIE